jgi:PAS domain-containing protein
MPDTPDLHDLTAELHAAVNHTQRWRAAWLALNEFMGDADQTGDGSTPEWCDPGIDRRCDVACLHPMGWDWQATYIAVLDALPIATWLCNENRHILHANAGGLAELKRQRWLKREADQLCACEPSLQQQLLTSFVDLATREARAGSPAAAAVQLKSSSVVVGLRHVAQKDHSHLSHGRSGCICHQLHVQFVRYRGWRGQQP